MMEAFSHLLMPKTQFYWDSGLEEAFCRSKEAIADEIRHGVEIFDKHVPAD